MDYRTCKIIISLSKQSPDIALGVDKSLETKKEKALNQKELETKDLCLDLPVMKLKN